MFSAECVVTSLSTRESSTPKLWPHFFYIYLVHFSVSFQFFKSNIVFARLMFMRLNLSTKKRDLKKQDNFHYGSVYFGSGQW